MQYHPKLKKAMLQIKAVLKEHDIAGTVVLHTPGHTEFLFHVDTSYSVARINGDQILFKTDPAWTKEVKQQRVTDTVNMLDGFANINGITSLQAFNLLEELSKIITILPGPPGTITTDTEQNN